MKNLVLRTLRKIAKEHNKSANAILFKIYEGTVYYGPEYENTIECACYKMQLHIHMIIASSLTSFVKLLT